MHPEAPSKVRFALGRPCLVHRRVHDQVGPSIRGHPVASLLVESIASSHPCALYCHRAVRQALPNALQLENLSGTLGWTSAPWQGVGDSGKWQRRVDLILGTPVSISVVESGHDGNGTACRWPV